MANPLTPEQIQALREALTQAKELLDDIDRAARAGIDVAERKKQTEAQIDQITKLLAVYG